MPVHTFNVEDPKTWISLSVFIITVSFVILAPNFPLPKIHLLLLQFYNNILNKKGHDKKSSRNREDAARNNNNNKKDNNHVRMKRNVSSGNVIDVVSNSDQNNNNENGDGGGGSGSNGDGGDGGGNDDDKNNQNNDTFYRDRSSSMSNTSIDGRYSLDSSRPSLDHPSSRPSLDPLVRPSMDSSSLPSDLINNNTTAAFHGSDGADDRSSNSSNSSIIGARLIIKKYFGRFSKYFYWVPIDLGMAPILALIFLALCGILTWDLFWRSIVGNEDLQPYAILLLFMSLTYMCLSIDSTGLFNWIAKATVIIANNKGHILFIAFMAFSSILTCFVTSNDTVILTLLPITCHMTMNSTNLDPLPYIIGIFFMANIWGLALQTGSTTNLIIAESIGLNFVDYLKWMVLPAILTGITCIIVLYIFTFRLVPWTVHEKEKQPSSVDVSLELQSATLNDIQQEQQEEQRQEQREEQQDMSSDSQMTNNQSTTSINLQFESEQQQQQQQQEQQQQEQEPTSRISENDQKKSKKDSNDEKGIFTRIKLKLLKIPPMKKKIPAFSRCILMIICLVFLAISSWISVASWLITVIFLALFIILDLITDVFIMIKYVKRRMRYDSEKRSYDKKDFSIWNISLTLKTLSNMPWKIIPFIIGMFVLVTTLKEYGFVSVMAYYISWIINVIGGIDGLSPEEVAQLSFMDKLRADTSAVVVMSIISTLACNMMNNQPLSILFIDIITDKAYNIPSEKARFGSQLSVIVSSNLGANLTPVGALAGVLIISLLRKYDHPKINRINFFTLLRYGLIVIPLVSIIPSIVLSLELVLFA